MTGAQKKTIQIVAAVGLLSMGLYQLYRAFWGNKAAIRYSCKPLENGVALICDFTAEKGSGSMCVDAVLTCADGVHRTSVCSGQVPHGKTVTQTSPPIAPPLAATSPPCKTEWHDRSN